MDIQYLFCEFLRLQSLLILVMARDWMPQCAQAIFCRDYLSMVLFGIVQISVATMVVSMLLCFAMVRSYQSLKLYTHMCQKCTQQELFSLHGICR